MIRDNKQPIDIVILSHERAAIITDMLIKIKERTHYPHRVIVCDNKSSALAIANLRKLKNEGFIDELILNNFNKWPEGFNPGLKIVNGDLYCLSDPDIIVPELERKCWLEQLAELMVKYPFMGKIGLHISMDNYPPKHAYSREYCISKFESKFVENTGNEIFEAPVDTTMAICRRDLFKSYNGGYPEIPSADHQSMYADKYRCGRTTPPFSCIHLGYDEYKDLSDENVQYIANKNKTIECKHYRRLIRTLKFKRWKQSLKNFWNRVFGRK
ncbi:glycosyltransferase [bacterium]|nr:glycosyltransferase [bacterium]